MPAAVFIVCSVFHDVVHLSFGPHITLCLTLPIGQSGSQSARAMLGKYLAMALPTRYPLPSTHLTTTNAYMLPTSGTRIFDIKL